jgi:hypothetical protein
MPEVSSNPVLISPEAVNFLAHRMFISAKKSFFTLRQKLKIGIVSDVFYLNTFTCRFPQTRM